MPRHTEVEIVPYRDGPYLVRGPVVIRDQDGSQVSLTRHPLALCRCGKSQLRPFCDGTHQLIGFSAPSEPERPSPEAPPAGDEVPVAGEQSLREAALALRGTDAAASRARQCIRGALRLLEDHNPIAARSLVEVALDVLSPEAAHDGADLRDAVDALGRAGRELEGAS